MEVFDHSRNIVSFSSFSLRSCIFLGLCFVFHEGGNIVRHNKTYDEELGDP